MWDNGFFLKKEINWSLLTQGCPITLDYQMAFMQGIHGQLHRGDSQEITIIFEGMDHRVTLKNQAFSEVDYPTHKDILQLRYGSNSSFARALQQVFRENFSYLKALRAQRAAGNRRLIQLPDDQKAYLVLYGTSQPGVFWVEAITPQDQREVSEYSAHLDEHRLEEEWQALSKEDGSTGIVEKVGVRKYRHLNAAIGQDLKVLYGYRCQICGAHCGEAYGVKVAEAHHIDYFVKSLNNNASNQMILCPNHHRIVHAAKPTFLRNERLWVYPNGLREGLTLDVHLVKNNTSRGDIY
ncbi:hypothetical protein SAMN04515656_1165 [Eubacterium aggregans]|uniref:HNH nuclease domain-containing protein n=1 Tax=Eubacterium aggregans TaxID=81409 RepID=A0A1H4CKE0_9FIRM|nr:HNH endonuclease [Eubacterium aggregans]SEA60798.1 hypothetical protein SAMN04515656_1165 [Eubacterium aggregans]